jgi:hypothetical protein
MTEGYQPERTPRLTASQRLVLDRLRLLGRLDSSGWCWPSVPYLAAELGRGERTIQRAVARLVELGLVERQERINASSRYRAVASTPTPVRPASDAASTPPDASPTPPPSKRRPRPIDAPVETTPHPRRNDALERAERAEGESSTPDDLLGGPLFPPSTVPSSPRATPARPREAGDRAVRDELRRLYFDGASAGLINVWVGQAAQAILAMSPDATPELVAEREAEARRRFGNHRPLKLAEHWVALGQPQQVGAPRPTNTARGRASADIARLHAIADELAARGPLDGHLLPPGGNA